MIDINGHTFIYDAFIRNKILYLVSHFCSFYDRPISLYVNGVKAIEVGYKEYEPVRYFFTAAPESPIVEIEINGSCYTVNVREVIVNPTDKIAVATLFKGDYERIHNFIKYYRNQGVDDFYFYYNGGDFPLNCNHKLPTGSGIYYRNWNFTYWNKNCAWRHAAQTGFLTTIRLMHMPDYKWLAFIDLDEYLFHKEYVKLRDYLNKVDTNVDVVQIRNHWAKKEERKIIYSKASSGWNQRTKCIYRGTYKDLCGIHVPKNTSKMLREQNIMMLHICDVDTSFNAGKVKAISSVTYDGVFHLK